MNEPNGIKLFEHIKQRLAEGHQINLDLNSWRKANVVIAGFNSKSALENLEDWAKFEGYVFDYDPAANKVIIGPKQPFDEPLKWKAFAYHQACENFDQLQCNARKDGIAIPVTHEERVACELNATKIRKEMYDRDVHSMGISFSDWVKATKHYEREFEIRFRRTIPITYERNH